MRSTNRFIFTSLIAIAFTGMVGCASHHAHYEQLWDQEDIAQFNHNDLYLVDHDGRLYVFDDTKVYQDFVKGGETNYRLTRIGEGPNGSTLVFGLRGKDKDKKSGIGGVELFNGKQAPFKRFYGQRVTDKQITLFDDLDALKKAISAPVTDAQATQISGPAGQAVFVSAKNPANDAALLATFKSLHGIK